MQHGTCRDGYRHGDLDHSRATDTLHQLDMGRILQPEIHPLTSPMLEEQLHPAVCYGEGVRHHPELAGTGIRLRM